MTPKQITKTLGKDYINLEKAKELKISLAQLKEIKKNNQVLIYIPAISAKDIYKKCGNQTPSGKLLYDIDWYKNEAFFAEKAKAGWYVIGKTLEPKTLSKTYAEQDEILKSLGSGRLSMSEITYFIYAYDVQNKERLLSGYKYHWSASRSSAGRLVFFGYADALGAYIDGWRPGSTSDDLGVVLSKSLSADNLTVDSFETLGNTYSENWEARISALEEDMNKLRKFLVF